MKNLFASILFAVCSIATVFGQGKSLTTPTIYGSAAYVSSSGATGGQVTGGPISQGSLSTISGISLTGTTWLDSVNLIWGDGLSNPLYLFVNTSNPTINLIGIQGAHAFTIQNGYSNANLSVLTQGTGTLFLESGGGGVYIKAQSFSAGYNITLDGNIVPGSAGTSPYGLANIGTPGNQFEEITAMHFSGSSTGYGQPTISAGSASGGGTASIAGNDDSGYITLVTGSSPGTGTIFTINYVENYVTSSTTAVLQEANGNSAALVNRPYISLGNTSSSNFSASVAVALAPNTTYNWWYTVRGQSH